MIINATASHDDEDLRPCGMGLPRASDIMAASHEPVRPARNGDQYGYGIFRLSYGLLFGGFVAIPFPAANELIASLDLSLLLAVKRARVPAAGFIAC